MKKIVSLVLTLCMLVACAMTFTPVYAEGEDIMVIADEVTGDIGDTVVLPISYQSAFKINAVRFRIYYDDGLRQIDGKVPNDKTDILTMTDKKGQYASGAVVTVGDLTADLDFTDPLPVYYAAFEIVSDAPSHPITLEIVEAARIDSSGEKPIAVSATAAAVNGEIKVNANSGTPVDDDEGYVVIPAGVTKAVIDAQRVASITAVDGVSSIVFSKNVTEIDQRALLGWEGDIVLMNPSVTIGAKAFGYSGSSFDKAVTIHGWTDSNAEKYVNDNRGALEFKGLEEFEHAGLQQGTGENANAFRYISRMKYAEEYQGAYVVIKASGLLGGVPLDKNDITVPINQVYKKLNNAYDEEKTVADGYHYSAINITGLPLDDMGDSDYIDFTYETHVINPCNKDVVTDTFTVTYKKDGGAKAKVAD